MIPVPDTMKPNASHAIAKRLAIIADAHNRALERQQRKRIRQQVRPLVFDKVA